MGEYKLKLRLVAHGVFFGFFSYKSTNIEVVEAKSASQAISKVRKMWDKNWDKHGSISTPKPILEVLEIEKL